MANTVNVKGGGDFDGAELQNAATESTLRKLVETLDKKQKGAGDKLQDLYNKALNKNIEATEETTDKQKEYQKTLSTSKTALEAFSEGLISITKAGVSGLFTGIVATGSMLMDFFKSSADAFNQTSKVGATFNYDLLELRKTAAEARMPLNEFVQTITASSKDLAALGGTVTDGAKQFAQFRKEFTDPGVNKQLYNLGFNAQELNSILTSQLKIEAISGRARDINSQKYTKELADYTKDLTYLSKITGVSATQMQEGVAQQLADGKMMFLQNKLTGKSLNNFRESLALMTASIDPKAFETLKNMMSGVIDPADKFGAMLAIAAPGILEFQRALGKGELSVDQQVEGYERQSKQIERFLSRFSDQMIARNPALKQLQEYGASIKKFTGDQGRALLEGQRAQDGFIGIYNSFTQMLEVLKGQFFEKLFDSQTMKRIQDAVNRFSAVIQDKFPKIIDRLKPVIDKAVDWFDHIINGLIGIANDLADGNFSPEKIWAWVKESFGGAIKVIQDGIGAVISGLLGETPEQKAEKEKYAQASPEEQAKMREQNPMLAMPNIGGMFDSVVSGVKSLVDMVPSLTSFAAFFGITGAGAAVAGMGIAYGISALARAMLAFIPTIATVGAAIGFGGLGLGYMFDKLSNVIKEVGNSFDKLGNFFTTLGSMDSAKLAGVSEGIKVMASSVAELAGAGLTGLITSGSLESLSNTLTKIAELDPNKLGATGPALKSLAEGLKMFTGQGVADSVMSSFTSMFSGSAIDDMAKSLSTLGAVDLSKLANFSLFVQSVQDVNTNKTFDNFVKDSNVSGLIESINQFNTVDMSGLENVVSALGKVKTTMGDTFQNQVNDVDSFSKSIDNLIESLQKLEEQMKKGQAVTPETPGVPMAGGTPRPGPNQEISTGINTEELQRQLNTKVDELITQIKEMKQNTKDTADYLSGRRSAL